MEEILFMGYSFFCFLSIWIIFSLSYMIKQKKEKNDSYMVDVNKTFGKENSIIKYRTINLINQKNMSSKIVLIIISLILISIIVLISFYMYMNREAPNLYSILLKLGAPIIAAFLLLASDIYKDDRDSEKEFKVYFLIDKISGEPFPFHRLPKLKDIRVGVETIFYDLATIRSKRKEPFDLKKENIREESNQYLSISILYWLAENYNLHWKLVNKTFHGLDTEKFQFIAPQPKIEENKMEFSLTNFNKNFSKFNLNELPYNSISLPKKTNIKLQYKKEKDLNLIEKIIIENPYSRLEFLIGVGVESPLVPPNLGGGERANFRKLTKYIPNYQSWMQNIQDVTIKVHHSWLYQWSPETNLQKEWIEDLKERFEEEMDWSRTKEKFINTL